MDVVLDWLLRLILWLVHSALLIVRLRLDLILVKRAQTILFFSPREQLEPGIGFGVLSIFAAPADQARVVPVPLRRPSLLSDLGESLLSDHL